MPPDIIFPLSVGGDCVKLLLGIKNTRLMRQLTHCLPSGVCILQCAFRDAVATLHMEDPKTFSHMVMLRVGCLQHIQYTGYVDSAGLSLHESPLHISQCLHGGQVSSAARGGGHDIRHVWSFGASHGALGF
jgi:hypothetical protein